MLSGPEKNQCVKTITFAIIQGFLNVNVLLLLPRSNNLNDLVKIFVSLFYIKLHTTCFHSRTFKKCMLHMLSPHVEHQMVICQSWEENLIKSLIPNI